MKLPRPYVPLSVRVQVAERQLLACNIPPWPAKISNRERLRLSLIELFGSEPVELHHRPALCNREIIRYEGFGKDDPCAEARQYKPDANDPDYLVYLPAADHDIETRIRGLHGDYSDLAKARKRKRIARKAKRPKRKWPSRSFRR